MVRRFSCPRIRSKDGYTTRVFDAQEWLAAMTSHIPNKGEQMVRYYGYYSNASRGIRKKATSYQTNQNQNRKNQKEVCSGSGKAFICSFALLSPPLKAIYDPDTCYVCMATVFALNPCIDLPGEKRKICDMLIKAVSRRYRGKELDL